MRSGVSAALSFVHLIVKLTCGTQRLPDIPEAVHGHRQYLETACRNFWS